jgi:magnesium chelatase family protein
VEKYLNRISGPLLDRIDLHVEVVPVPFEELAKKDAGEKSSVVRERVMRARKIQTERFADIPNIHSNAQMSSKLIQKHCALDEQCSKLLKDAMDRLNLSARAYDRILKVSRTIADLAASENIKPEHLAEAIQYRSLDRESWGK